MQAGTYARAKSIPAQELFCGTWGEQYPACQAGPCGEGGSDIRIGGGASAPPVRG